MVCCSLHRAGWENTSLEGVVPHVNTGLDRNIAVRAIAKDLYKVSAEIQGT